MHVRIAFKDYSPRPSGEIAIEERVNGQVWMRVGAGGEGGGEKGGWGGEGGKGGRRGGEGGKGGMGGRRGWGVLDGIHCV
jgi:hypothetical protein